MQYMNFVWILINNKCQKTFLRQLDIFEYELDIR